MAIDRSLLLGRAREIEALRPAADHSLEQFLMEPTSMVEQIGALEGRIESMLDEVVLLGDDDHMSLLISEFLHCRVHVFEIDLRVVDSINENAARQGLPVIARQYDVRDAFPEPSAYTFFYVNPPYSSKTKALGVKVWITRALEACTKNCRGVVVMPAPGHLEWTRANLFEVQTFLVANGCVVTGVNADRHAYEATNDLGLMSTNYFVERVNGNVSAPVENIDQETRIYR